MKKRIEWGSNEIFISNYKKLKSSRKMAELYKCNKKAVIDHCKKIGFDYNSVQQYKLTKADKQKIKAEYNKKTSSQLAEEYKVTRGMITKIWYDAKLKGKERDNSNNGHDLIGKKFGYLTVIDCSNNRESNGGKRWICKCDCKQDGCLHIKEVNGGALISGKIISCGCIGRSNLEIGRGLNFRDLSGQTFGKLTVIKRVEDVIFESRNCVNWKCKCECGNIAYVITTNLVTGNTQSCGFCKNNSHGNIKIEALLKEAKIYFEREKRFDTCRNKFPLPFDFFVENKYVIEYDGKQHYQNNSFFFNDKIPLHDEIKSKWCKNNNIPLIRIPYTKYDTLCLEDLLLETSNFVE